MSIEAICDVAMHPEMYCYDETPKRFNSYTEPRLHSEITINDIDINETKFCIYRDASEVVLILGTSYPPTQKRI